MRWLKPNLRNSLHAIFTGGLPIKPAEEDPVFSIEDIRARMMSHIPDNADERAIMVRRRINYAVTVEALWFLRGDLMAVLSRNLGEAAALEQIAGISEMFDDLLPAGLRSRPSPLGRN
jgi:hypothetical protein